MLKKALYPKIKPAVDHVAGILDRNGFTPNQLTLAGLVMSFLAGWLFAGGALFLGAIMVLLTGAADLLDGAVARVGKKTSDFGAFLDSALDRYTDFFLFGGLAIYFAREAYGDYLLITLGIMAGVVMMSYSRLCAEKYIKNCDVGFFDRSFRMTLLFLGTAVLPLLPVCLWALLLGSNGTAIYRIFHTYKTLEKKAK